MDVAGVTSAAEIAAGGDNTCARLADGSVRCWGLRPLKGWPGTANVSLAGATRLAVGAMHGCASVGGGLKCWGTNNVGQLGTGYTDFQERVP